LNKSRFFRFLYGFILGLLTGLLIYSFLIKPKFEIEIPVMVEKIKPIKDTIPYYEFQIIKIPSAKQETIYKPILWKLFKYRDSLLEIQFEADTFRNFEYKIFQKEKVIFKSIFKGPKKEKYGEVFAGITFSNIHIGLSYKFLSFFVQYNFKDKNFIPGIGVRWQF